MTDEEALALKPGDWVEDTNLRGDSYSRRRQVVEVLPEGRYRARGGVAVHVRLPGAKRDGSMYGGITRRAQSLRLVPVLDPVTANVYADFLDERGEARAADLLRRAFPLDQGED